MRDIRSLIPIKLVFNETCYGRILLTYILSIYISLIYKFSFQAVHAGRSWPGGGRRKPKNWERRRKGCLWADQDSVREKT